MKGVGSVSICPAALETGILSPHPFCIDAFLMGWEMVGGELLDTPVNENMYD